MNVEQALPAIAAYRLKGSAAPPIEWDNLNAEALWHRCAAERLSGLLIATLSDADCGPDDFEGWSSALEHLATSRVGLLVDLERHAAQLVAHLDAAGVPAAIVKGVAIARSAYPHHWWRDFGDIDLLVPAVQFRQAVQTLGDLGIQPIVAPPSKRAMQYIGKGLTLRHPIGFEIDLHHTLLSRSQGLGRGWECWMADSTSVPVAGTDVLTTGPAVTLVHMLAHLCIGGQANALHHIARDAAQLLGRVPPESATAVDAQRLISRLGLDGLMEVGIDRSRDLLVWDGGAWRSWREGRSVPASWTEVAARHDEESEFSAVAAEALRRAPTIGARLVLAGAMLWPASAHLRDRGLTRREHLVRLARGATRASRLLRRGEPFEG
ncbi:MAG: nucleotidyltransferase family protein [Microthrixaceae bacterium]|nr:nucleotidyltransferase family protein [Microthrixaceae bacterium]